MWTDRKEQPPNTLGDRGGYRQRFRTPIGVYTLNYFIGRELPFHVDGPLLFSREFATLSEASSAVRDHLRKVREEIRECLASV